jgi:hypothetical protein
MKCMSITTKSPRYVALEALAVGEQSFSSYSHEYSPRRYTQAQLFACLVLKTFFNMDYRGIETLLHDSKELCKELKLPKVPHFTTLQKACRRLLKQKQVNSLLETTVLRHYEHQKKPV